MKSLNPWNWLIKMVVILSFILTVSCSNQTTINTSQSEPVTLQENNEQQEDLQSIKQSQDTILKNEGILYIRSEYHQAQMGLSIITGGGSFGPLTTTYEWWIDVQNPLRIRRVTTEWLEDGPHIVVADGSDGNNKWWIVDWSQGITLPEYHEDEIPFAFPDINGVVEMFSNNGQGARMALEQGNAQLVQQTTQNLWGRVDIIQQDQLETGQIITTTVRSEVPYILVERVVKDADGNLFESLRLTNWDWLDIAQLPSNFWMSLPPDIPVGR